MDRRRQRRRGAEDNLKLGKKVCGKRAIENAISNNEMALQMQACEFA